MDTEHLEYDVLIVGAGPAGLSAAVRLGQLNQAEKKLSIAVLEKGSQVGSHILSGCLLETRALDELLADWQNTNAPITNIVQQESLLFLTPKKSWSLPVPPPLQNKKNYIISLENFCRWLAEQAQQLGVEIFSGFGAAEIYYAADKVAGVITSDVGKDKQGKPTAHFQPGVVIKAKQILLAEGCDGSLTKKVIAKYSLRKNSPQTFGLGIKELWEVDIKNFIPGKTLHTIGWPLTSENYGGGFLYHWQNNIIATGFIVGLDYKNPYFDPFAEMQRFKTHPAIEKYFLTGKRIGYGARAVVEGGIQSLPQLTFPNGMIIGDAAGFLNVAKLKGTHTAMKSGMIAAETIFAAGRENNLDRELTEFFANIKNSWLWEELYRVRNIRPGFQSGLWPGLINAAISTYLFHGKEPWTLKNHADYQSLKPAAKVKKIIYPKPDGKITFDKLSSVYLSNTHYHENQPCHLVLKKPEDAININYKIYASPETKYCPAQVFEIVNKDSKPYLQINGSNCIQCKTCDIKDPTQNIVWTMPEGGDGPEYVDM